MLGHLYTVFFSIINVYIVMVCSHVQVAPVREAYRHIHSTSNVELGNLEDYYLLDGGLFGFNGYWLLRARYLYILRTTNSCTSRAIISFVLYHKE